MDLSFIQLSILDFIIHINFHIPVSLFINLHYNCDWHFIFFNFMCCSCTFFSLSPKPAFCNILILYINSYSDIFTFWDLYFESFLVFDTLWPWGNQFRNNSNSLKKAYSHGLRNVFFASLWTWNLNDFFFNLEFFLEFFIFLFLLLFHFFIFKFLCFPFLLYPNICILNSLNFLMR